MTIRKTVAKPQRKTGVREAAAQATRDAILKAATKVFAKYGYEGGSVEKISKAAKSYDRMIYYYFGSKEGLFVAVLEGIYQRMDEAEAAIALDASRPVEALTEVIRFVHGYYRLLLPEHDQVFAYVRSLGDERLLVVVNLSGSEAHLDLGDDVHLLDGDVLLGSLPADGTLAPWQQVVVGSTGGREQTG